VLQLVLGKYVEGELHIIKGAFATTSPLAAACSACSMRFFAE